jgi:hypothetical protein
MSYRVDPDAYCTEDGCTNPRATGMDVCAQHVYLGRLSGQPFYQREEEQLDPEVAALKELFALDAAPEPAAGLRAAVSPVEAYDRAMRLLARVPDGSKIKAVGEALRVDGTELVKLCLARVAATMEACTADEAAASDEQDEARLIAGHLYGMAVEIFAAGLEVGRSEIRLPSLGPSEFEMDRQDDMLLDAQDAEAAEREDGES